MTAQGEDILAWLDRAISEREEAVRSAATDPIASMSHQFASDAETLRRDISCGRSAQDGRLEYDKGQADALHWASVVLPERMKPLSLHDPESVLRRCAADRKLLELHQPMEDPAVIPPNYLHCHTCCAPLLGEMDQVPFPCATVLALAEGYGWTGGER